MKAKRKNKQSLTSMLFYAAGHCGRLDLLVTDTFPFARSNLWHHCRHNNDADATFLSVFRLRKIPYRDSPVEETKAHAGIW